MSSEPPIDLRDTRAFEPLRVTGVVELSPDGDQPLTATAYMRRRELERTGRLVWASSVVLAGLAVTLPVASLIAEMVGHRVAAGSLQGFSPSASPAGLVLAVLLSGVLLFAGYALRGMFRTADVAEGLAQSARRFASGAGARVEVDPAAARLVGSMQDQVVALNEGIDGALRKLAAVEGMIRQHVGAIDEAGRALHGEAGAAADRIAGERDRLMSLTEALNRQAEDFAAAIAEKARISVEAMQHGEDDIAVAEKEIDARVARLEAAAGSAFKSFKALHEALSEQSVSIERTAAATERAADAAVSRLDGQKKKISDARDAIAAENARLDELISEQRARAERLADEITGKFARPGPTDPAPSDPKSAEPLTLTDPIADGAPPERPAAEKPSDALRASLRRDIENIGLPERRSGSSRAIARIGLGAPRLPDGASDRLDELARELAARRAEAARANLAGPDERPKDKSWREILAAMDEDGGPTPKETTGAATRRRKRALERGSYDLEKRINGEPSREAVSRYEGGQRDVFAVRLLSEGESELKARVADLAGADADFLAAVRTYLTDFDAMMEIGAERDEAEKTLEAFLNSAFGRVYMILGSAVGHFD